MKERQLWADSLKLFAIYLVVWGHAVASYTTQWDFQLFDATSRLYLYAFHMPLFMILSGYFSSKILINGGDVLKRFKSLIVPCITLFIVLLICDIHNQNMWYLKCLFICYGITSLYVRYICPKISFLNSGGGKLSLHIIIICLGMFFSFPILARLPYVSLYKVDFMLPYFIFGIFINKRMADLIATKKFLALCFILMVLSMIFWSKEYIWYYSSSQWFPLKEIWLTHHFAFDWDNVRKVLTRFFVGAVSSLFFISMFYQLSKFKPFDWINRHFGKYGRYTLHVYILQTFFVEINCLNINIPTHDSIMYQFVYCPMMALVITIICIVLAQQLEKIRVVRRFLFGDFSNRKFSSL